MKNKNIVIVVHKFHTNPDDDLVYYLNRNKASNVLHIRHSFSDAPDRASYYTWYKSGRPYKEYRTLNYQFLPEPLIYLKEFLYTIYWLFRSGLRWDYYIGMDGLCTNFGLPFKRFLFKKIVCWSIDFVPTNRFDSVYKNFIYRKLNVNAFQKSDEMWDHTPKMVEEKKRILGLNPNTYKKHRIVPLGLWIDRIKVYPYEKCNQHELVFLGHILEKQGIQLVIRSIPHILKFVPDFRFKVIGSGNYLSSLKDLVREMKLDKYVSFMGRIERDEDVEAEVAKSSAGIAPYIKNLDTFTQYGADPGKIKAYLACGLPVLLTDVSYNAKEVVNYGCGFIIKEDERDIATKIVKVLTDSHLNRKLRSKSMEYRNRFDYNSIFKELDL